MNNGTQGSTTKPSVDEEPSAKKQRLLSRSKNIELSEDEVNAHQALQNDGPTTSRVERTESTVSISSVSNIDLKAMVTKSLTLEPHKEGISNR